MTYTDTINKLLSGAIQIGVNPIKRKYWPRFAFHFTDINNAVNILKLGALVSRQFAASHGMMINDNASDTVISYTKSRVKDYVRLYFRPRTPTQFYNEGFQTLQARQGHRFSANCPVPVFFLFNMASLLELPETQFSDQSLAQGGNVALMNTPEEYSKLPFSDIYHDASLWGFSNERKHEIKEHKHAEIVVPNKLDLTTLRYIYVRSIAEKETFLELLHEAGVFRYDPIIRVGDESTFYMDRNFVYDGNLTAEKFSIRSRVKDAYPREWGERTRYAVNPDNSDYYLDFKVTVTLADGQKETWPQSDRKALLKENIAFKWREPHSEYSVRVTIDGHVAYIGKYHNEADDLPF